MVSPTNETNSTSTQFNKLNCTDTTFYSCVLVKHNVKAQLVCAGAFVFVCQVHSEWCLGHVQMANVCQSVMFLLADVGEGRWGRDEFRLHPSQCDVMMSCVLYPALSVTVKYFCLSFVFLRLHSLQLSFQFASSHIIK